MFLREEIKKVKEGPARCVSYCRDCKGKRIKTVQTCVLCGSHDIANPGDFYNLDSKGYDDTYGTLQKYREEQVKIYKCDLCGKEFNGLKTDNYLCYNEGEFNCGNSASFATGDYPELYGDYCIDYQLQKDLCKDCKYKLKTFLDNKLLQFVSNDNIQELVNGYIEHNKE